MKKKCLIIFLMVFLFASGNLFSQNITLLGSTTTTAIKSGATGIPPLHGISRQEKTG